MVLYHPDWLNDHRIFTGMRAVSVSGFAALGEALAAGEAALESLRISGYPFGRDPVAAGHEEALLAALSSNDTLTRLTLDQCELDSNAALSALAGALIHNRSLRRIDISCPHSWLQLGRSR